MQMEHVTYLKHALVSSNLPRNIDPLFNPISLQELLLLVRQMLWPLPPHYVVMQRECVMKTSTAQVIDSFMTPKNCILILKFTGASSDCPTDVFVSSSTVCRSSSGICDASEYCTGTIDTHLDRTNCESISCRIFRQLSFRSVPTSNDALQKRHRRLRRRRVLQWKRIKLSCRRLREERDRLLRWSCMCGRSVCPGRV